MTLFQERKTLRPHQEEAITKTRLSIGKGNKRVVVQGPTGFGKTLVAANIINNALEKGKRVVFTAPAISLINQTVEAFEAEGISDIGVMQGNHPRYDPFAMVQVATVQTLARRTIPEADIFIIDECHVSYEVVDNMMAERDSTYFIGLSATPWAKGMGHKWDDLVVPITIGGLIDQGYLSKFTVFAPSVPDLSGVKTQAGDYVNSQLEEVMSEKKLVSDVVQTWLEKGENRPTLCFCVNRAHAAQLHAIFEGAGVASAYCDGLTDGIERADIERRFRAGEIKVVCSVRTMTTGVDWPVSCIIDAAPTKSEMLHVQKIGRGLRVNKGTEDLIILDHASNSFRLGLVTDIKYDCLDVTEKGERQVKKKAEKLPQECSSCQTLFSGLICPQCGYERKPISGVETETGELIDITKSKKPTMNEKQEFYSMALWLDREKRKGGRLLKGMYKGKFDVWPKGMRDIPKRPDQKFMNYVKSQNIAYAKRMEALKNAAR